MIFINLTSTDPYLNLAVEEYLLKNFSDNVLMLWQDEKSVVVGKHQNMLAEVNYPYTMQNGISLVRRLSGGGAVVHDLGNINYTYIYNGTAGALVNFEHFMQPIVDFLCKLGLNAVRSNNNDILINGMKVSGNAEHVYKSRVLHHGTLLFSSDLEQLAEAIRPSGALYEGKSVKSKKAPVANIQQHLASECSTYKFRDDLTEYFLRLYRCDSYELSEADMAKAAIIRDQKYVKWDWNFGYTPDYSFVSNTQSWRLYLEVRRGIIQDASFSFGEVGKASISIRNLKGVEHDNFEAISRILVDDLYLSKELFNEIKCLLY